MLLASIATTLTPGLYELVGKEMKVPELILSAGLATDHFAALNDRRIDIVGQVANGGCHRHDVAPVTGSTSPSSFGGPSSARSSLAVARCSCTLPKRSATP